MSPKKVTLAEIAKDAGVSPTTVSHYVNGNYKKMASETREKINRSIVKMGYHVNPIAKSLITGRKNTIGLIWTNGTQDMYFEDLYFMHFARILKQELREIGFKLMLLDLTEDLNDMQLVDAIVVKATIDTEKYMPKLCDLNIPVITIGRHNLSYNAYVVRVDDFRSGQEGVEYLISKNYENIIILTYPHGQVPGFDDRLNGASENLRKNGKFTTVIQGNMREGFGYQTVLELADNNQLPQALFCLNDVTAIGALKACKELNISVPSELAILGVDDMPTVSELLDLSTIRHPIEQLAKSAGKHLLEMLETDEKVYGKQEDVLPVQLIERRTS